jgi:lambda repressor-like predicted transcriptional regulator
VSYLLDAVTEAAGHRQESEHEYRRAVVRAHQEGHSLREIARAAGLTHNAIVNVLKREEQRKP